MALIPNIIMKKLPLTIFVLLIHFVVNAQLYEHIYDSSFSIRNRVRYICDSYDNGFLFNRKDDSHRFIISKTNRNGEIIWTKVINNSITDAFYTGGITSDSLGNTYISGAGLFDTEHRKTAIIKLDPCGNVLWCNYLEIPHSEFNYGMHIFTQNDGSIILHARLAGFWDWIPFEREQLIKFNSDGCLLWINHIIPEYEHEDKIEFMIDSCIPDSDGGMYLSGSVYMQDSLAGDTLWHPKAVVVKTDEFGDEEYISIFDTPEDNISMVFTSLNEIDSQIYATGYYYNLDISKIEPVICTVNKENGELGFMNIQSLTDQHPTGQCIMLREINTGFISAQVKQASPEAHHNILHLETFDHSLNSIDSVVFNDRCLASDRSTLVYDSSSILYTGLVWEDPINSDRMKGMAMKVNHNLTIDSIQELNLNYDTLCPYTIQSGTEDCTCYPIHYVGIEDLHHITLDDLEGLKAYPNPASDNITFETKTISKNRIVQIYNITGELISEVRFPLKSTTLSYNTSALNHGTYIAQLFIEGRKTGTTKFIIQ